jgi:hypothetical protein
VTRSRAVDDFAAIRSRMEELRRERKQMTEEGGDFDPAPRAGTVASGSRPRSVDQPGLSPVMKRILARRIA